MSKVLLGTLLLGLIPLISGPVSAQSIPRVTVSGFVVDDSTETPLFGVNVFIANTMLGAATGPNGFFYINHVPLGTHELVASMMGYEFQKLTIRLTEPVDKRIDIRLKAEVLQGVVPEIEVVASRPAEWKKRLKKFKELFLGTSSNAGKCRILNPEVLAFEVDKEIGLFRAEASQPLQIENRALGYRALYILQEFRLQDQILKYKGVAKFEELFAKGTKEEREVEKNRLEAYYGSFRHFLSALTRGRLKEEGFKLWTVATLPRDEKTSYPGERVDPDSLLYAGELPFEKRLYFPDFLQVVYTHEWDNPTSWIELNRVATLDTLGHLYEPFALIVHGHWAGDRFAEMLPWEYEP